MRLILANMSAVLLALLCADSALAQGFAPPSAPRAPRPTLSPYLNLLNRNNSAAFNYYNRVRPRQSFDDYRSQQFRNLSNLERRIEQTEQGLRQSQNSQLQPSGHTTRFLDLGGYFGTNSARGSATRR